MNEETNKYFKAPVSFARRVGKGFNVRHRKFLNNNKQFLIENSSQINDQFTAHILEIGSGNGHHLLNLCKQNPSSLVIGAEVFLSGVVQSLQNALEQNVQNLQFFADDVNLLLGLELNFKFSKIYILFPDPWPKRKQNKRRLINTDFITKLLVKLENEGQIIIATDHPDYAKWVAEHLNQTNMINYQKTDQAPVEYSPTKYHSKDMAGYNLVTWFYITKRI
ncbi:tRNA (guanosine(46)-N7)-methyltransferase TrmB [Rickettsiales endosymbiont of Stachyamoeba lipophora]|uniref:tRNA (guanosine(46)-N7)-methyltransferase TrmB n=1 Tax=Rickettsiales endosymbiont of Stachyamoeba lipophora TaxID=2486578 RepID=UPI000F65559A|nr:tRNA (guanosine(46)-N7)-methyltransferase TrmB [Rickettsiales endosymbiont of Stachyamoeba lipophora]AZL15953.1 tRNA (guanosine(46)-N7)-methyltransferase TrmB [Rickettsiales endosymbiont of Stachyamoeba lipophora]